MKKFQRIYISAEVSGLSGSAHNNLHRIGAAVKAATDDDLRQVLSDAHYEQAQLVEALNRLSQNILDRGSKSKGGKR